MTDIRYLYITTKDLTQARDLARKALEARVAACANILPGMESMYWWNGKLETSNECVLILKTQVDKVAAATQLITNEHIYDVPCILSIPIEAGHEPYLNWLRVELK